MDEVEATSSSRIKPPVSQLVKQILPNASVPQTSSGTIATYRLNVGEESQNAPYHLEIPRARTAVPEPCLRAEKVVLDEGSPPSDGGLGHQSATLTSRRQSYGSVDVYQRVASHQKRLSVHTPSTPPARPSVQFARNASDMELQESSHSEASSDNDGDADPGSRERKPSLLTKLKALAVSTSFPSHSRSASGAMVGEGSLDQKYPNDTQTPASDRVDYRFPRIVEQEGSEADSDADAEESPGEQRSRFRRRRKHRRPHADSDPQTAPASPRTNKHPSLPALASFSGFESHDPSVFPRRVTMDVYPQRRDGVSEDEGRERLRRDMTWRRRSSAWISGARGLTYSGRQDVQIGTDEKRHSNLRRLTTLTGASDNPEGTSASWKRHRQDRGSSLSAQKWRQIKAGLKMIAQRRKTENTVDHVKSAELLAELMSGVPAALILASMFQRDEHGSRRIPILLEQLKVQITDSLFDSHSGDRPQVFRIELEYGSGMTRMKWVVHRTLRDFANLHLKYKLHIGTQKYIQMRNPEARQGLPRFPRSTFPYLRGVRGLDSDKEDEEDAGDETGAEANSGNEKGRKSKKRRSSIGAPRRRSSLSNQQDGDVATTSGAPENAGNTAVRKESFPERQRKKLESYLQKMIRFLIFRPDSNRLCKFLELSALGVRLAAEGSYHGKEGFLVIQSAKGLDFRNAFTPTLIKKRHSPKWFLVRHSYIVCVDSPEEMNIYDVFLVDPFFQIQAHRVRLRDQNPKELARSAKETATHPKHHTLRVENSERKLRLLARNERQLHQFEDSIRFMAENTIWSKQNRFDSFAPVRQRCFAQWLVDGRDYMWVVSRAINQAKDVIYIHDWWLSPELYLRRPAAISQKWRLDRLLQRKAREGVKVFVIMYRNINSAIPIDSEYSKFSLLDLHPNIFVQRSPNQFRQNTFFWAHHEKICIIDHTLAFVGGIDLCFGRWDTPQHPVTDDKPTGFEASDLPKDADHCQLWPGKDYSNPRVQDFYDLDKPYEEMYDRTVIPRMPWHDISMHVVGQPARDLTRHFVQRWNYILRQRKPTRPTPFLLPPPDFNPADLEALGLDGSCEVQILRSSSMWSTGTPEVTEHSIMDAYVQLIKLSEHFVYIENQFFISTCEIDGKRIENLIGDALVERIVRAAKNGEAWRAVILIPLMPGFQNTVDQEGGTSVRLIMQCQYRSICRGETSIFGRLRAQGIEPEDYIQFFSLRTWGTIGPNKQLVTEQLYIHAKCMVVDDRVAIIGSANINERSMLGSRDSECAAVVRDTDMVRSTMNGKPYLVGRFPYTLRLRLMREHLGIDVDEVLEQEMVAEAEQHKVGDKIDQSPVSREEKQNEREMIERRHRIQDEFLTRSEDMHSFNHDVDWEQARNPNLKSSRKVTADARVTENMEHRKDVDGDGADRMNMINRAGLGNGRDSQILSNDIEVLVSDLAPEGKGTLAKPKKSRHPIQQSSVECDDSPSKAVLSTQAGGSSSPKCEPQTSQALHTSDTEIASSPSARKQQPEKSQPSHPIVADLKLVSVDKDCMIDLLNDTFYFDTWHAAAENNTKIFRAVFRCMPDSEVKSWKEYKEYAAYGARFTETQNHPTTNSQAQRVPSTRSNRPSISPTPAGPKQDPQRPPQEGEKTVIDLEVPPLAGNADASSFLLDEEVQRPGETDRLSAEAQPTVPAKEEAGPSQDEKATLKGLDSQSSSLPRDGENFPDNVERFSEKEKSDQLVGYLDPANASLPTQPQKVRRRTTTRGSKREFHASDGTIDKCQAKELLDIVQGRLVLWPYDWLEKEEQGGNWLYTLDQISPIEIYN